MNLLTIDSRYSFDPTPRLKSSPVPILFIPLSNYSYECNYCKSEYSKTSYYQLYCKNCLFDYVKNLSDKNTYLDVHIHTEKTQCIEHELRNEDCFTQNIHEWCKSCSEILRFNQIFTDYYRNFNTDSNERINCKLCGYESCPKYSLCPNCYLISSEWIESTLDKKPIPIIYLPWWDTTSICIACGRNLEYKSDCQKWCSRCYIIYTGCRYCLTTNIIFGITEQSKCRKCKRVIAIDITDIEYHLKDFLIFNEINKSNHHYIINYMNNIDQKSNLTDSVYNFVRNLKYHQYQYPNNHFYPINTIKTIGFIFFIPFINNVNTCYYCKRSYSKTILFKQKYCKYCLYWYIKFTKFTTQNMVDLYIITNSNTKCTEHEPGNLDFCTQNIQEWCINCSDILCFKYIITQYTFDKKNQDYKIQEKLLKNIIYHHSTFMNSDYYLVSSEYTVLNLTRKTIPILQLPWWDTFSNCIICIQELEYKSNHQKWCSHCFIIYSGCKYCLTTNIIFGFTDQSQCIKCKRVEPININGNRNIDDELLNSTIETTNYVNRIDKDNNPLKIYSFIKNNLDIIKNIRIINYSETKDFERIAEGGFGIIYKATWNNNLSDSSIVAVKNFSKSQNISKYFINELKSFDQYHNRFEHIIKYYGITQDPETKDHMIIMQYADGGDLHNYLQKYFKDITWNDKLTIILEISRGVVCIHEENYIHRDLHSGNILSVKSKNSINHKWHIGDLGLSQPANITSSNNEIYGVIPYISPEIFNGKAFSKESDIYSLGMVMWELTTGCKPFADIGHDTELIYKIIDGKRPGITNDTPECFANLIRECWNSDPSKRPHIKEIRKTISSWADTMKDIDQFNQAETKRLRLTKERKLGPGSAVNSHSGAIFTSRLLNPSISELSSISSSSTTPFSTKQKYVTKSLEFDVNDDKGLSSSEINSTIQNSLNTQHTNAIYTSRPLNELLPTKQEYNSKEIEFDINDVQWSPLPKINSTVQNSLNTQHSNVNYSSKLSNSINSSRKRKIAEIEIETQDNDRKLTKTNDNLHPDC